MATNDSLSIQFLMAAVRRIPVPRDYIAQEYLPMVPVSTDELTWDVIKDEQQLAGVYAINNNIKPGDDPIVSQAFADVMRIGSSRILDENTVRILRDPGTVGIETGVVGDLRGRANRKVADGLARANGEVDVTLEYLGMQALQGYITWPPPEWNKGQGPRWDAATFSIDYNFPAASKPTALAGINVNGTTYGGTAWWTTVATANPIADLAGIDLLITENGGMTGPKDVIISKHAAYYLMQNTALQTLLRQSEHATGLANWSEFSQFIETTMGWRFRFYDTMYTQRIQGATALNQQTIRKRRILPSNKALIVPRGSGLVGDFATSPSMPNDWNTGKFTWRKETQNPWNVEVGVGINAFPRITQPESIVVFQWAEQAFQAPDVTQ